MFSCTRDLSLLYVFVLKVFIERYTVSRGRVDGGRFYWVNWIHLQKLLYIE